MNWLIPILIPAVTIPSGLAIATLLSKTFRVFMRSLYERAKAWVLKQVGKLGSDSKSPTIENTNVVNLPSLPIPDMGVVGKEMEETTRHTVDVLGKTARQMAKDAYKELHKAYENAHHLVSGDVAQTPTKSVEKPQPSVSSKSAVQKKPTTIPPPITSRPVKLHPSSSQVKVPEKPTALQPANVVLSAPQPIQPDVQQQPGVTVPSPVTNLAQAQAKQSPVSPKNPKASANEKVAEGIGNSAPSLIDPTTTASPDITTPSPAQQTKPIISTSAAAVAKPVQKPVDPNLAYIEKALFALSKIIQMVYEYQGVYQATYRKNIVIEHISLLDKLSSLINIPTSQTYSQRAICYHIKALDGYLNKLDLRWTDSDPRMIIVNCLNPFAERPDKYTNKGIATIFALEAKRIIDAIEQKGYRIEKVVATTARADDYIYYKLTTQTI